MGYVLRLTEQNGYESLSWIFQMADVNYEKAHQACMLAFETPENLTGLAQLAGINSIELTHLTYPRVPGANGVPLHFFLSTCISEFNTIK